MNLIGMAWTRNEGDILEETMRDAAKKVDALYVADGHSTDGSWAILQRLKAEGVVEHIQQEDERKDRAQRNSLLAKIRERYKPEDTWVQIFESDVFVMDTDIRAAIRDHAVKGVGVPWIMLNAVRKPGTWDGADTYPEWKAPIREVMPFAHYAELVLYTFRPLPELFFDNDKWRPWPLGFSEYTRSPVKRWPHGVSAPLLLHVGYRGPTHFHLKYRSMGTHHTRHVGWRIDIPESVEQTVPYFNGVWNGPSFPATREGWRKACCASRQ